MIIWYGTILQGIDAKAIFFVLFVKGLYFRAEENGEMKH
jgi:hypothetical protein